MVRINITLPEDIIKELRRVKNKSGFIAETLRDRFAEMKKSELEQKLAKAYQKSAQEDVKLVDEWDAVAGDGME